MTTFVIDPQAISFTKAKSDIQAYLSAKPESVTWRDFYESSAGTTLVELLAGFSVFELYTTAAQRRETFLEHCTTIESARAISRNLGYSSARGTNSKFNLVILPTATIALNQFDLIGTYQDKEVRVLQAVVLQAGVSISIACVLGTVVTEAQSFASSALQTLSFTTQVSDDLIVTKDGSVLTTTNRVLDLETNYVVITNPVGSVDVSYMNLVPLDPLYYVTGTLIALRGIATDLTIPDLTKVLCNYGGVTSTSLISDPILFETVAHIQKTAPLYHETQVLVRSRNDYAKTILILDPTLVDTNSMDVSPLVVDTSYVRADETLLSAADKTALLALLEPHRPFGVQPPPITDPVVKAASIAVTVSLITGTVISSTTVEDDLRQQWDKFEKKLGLSLDYIEMEYLAELSLSYARNVRVIITNGIPTTLLWNEYYKFTYAVTLI